MARNQYKIVSEKDDGMYYVDLYSIGSYWDAVDQLDEAFPGLNHINSREFYWDRVQLNNDEELIYFKLIANNLRTIYESRHKQTDGR